MIDKDIIRIFKTKRYSVNPILLKQYVNRQGKRYNEEVYQYVNNRYTDSFSFTESIYRIVKGIEEHPICPVCGKLIPFHLSSYKLFNDTCCASCSSKLNYKIYINKETIEKSKETRKKTLNTKYGVDNAFQIPEVKEKILSKHLLLYKTKEYKEKKKLSTTKTNKYFIDTYGCNPNQLKEVKEKKRKTNLLKFGTPCPLQNPIIAKKAKETMILRYGAINYSISIDRKKKLEKIKEKIYNTMKKNNTFNTSKPEDELYLYIKSKFPNVKRQYKDVRYPWCCDFYIPELDYFIELQGTWTHGNHPFSSTNKDDLYILEYWKKKVEEGHRYYDNAIQTWTIKDIEKRECAKRNNLNFQEVWSLSEGKAFTDKLYAQFIEEAKKFIGDL